MTSEEILMIKVKCKTYYPFSKDKDSFTLNLIIPFYDFLLYLTLYSFIPVDYLRVLVGH